MHATTLLAQNGFFDFFSGLFALGFFFWILMVIATIFWIWMMVDALVNERRTEEKLLWFLVIFLLHFIGALIYYFVRRAGRARAW